MKVRPLRAGCWNAALLAGALLSFAAAAQPASGVLYGFTAFPYDLTEEAERRIDELIAPNANLYAIHMDECVPWTEALADAPMPAGLRENWRKDRARIAPGQTIYVAVTPTSMDRRSLARPCGASDGAEGSLPRELNGAKLSDAAVQRAYLNYVKRVVEAFDPAFLNLGIEISELALNHPAEWPAFQELFLNTQREIKRMRPQIRIGIELVLQSLLLPRVAALVKPAVDASDYVGISFYPYASSFGEHFGAPRLPPPPEQWRAALDWLRTWTDKPIAICETGYSSEKLTIREAGGLPLGGDAALQQAFLEDLVRIAVRDRYLFVVWFVLVDYTKLLAKLPGAQEWMRIWVHTGLFTPALEPKPAWAVWQRWKRQDLVASEPAPAAAAAPPAPAAARTAAAPANVAPPRGLQCSPGSSVEASAEGPQGGMSSALWTVRYAKDWALCAMAAGAPRDATGVRLWIRSDKDDFVLVRLQERSGEAFFDFVQAGAEWREVEIPFAKFQPDPAHRRDGRLQPEQIELLQLGEGAGADGAEGTRRFWIAEFGFAR